MIAAERETTITSTDADDLVRVWTAQPRYITRLRKNPAFTEVKSGFYDGSEYAEFTIPSDRWNPASGAKRTVLRTAAQKQRAAEALEDYRRSKALESTQRTYENGERT